jgi:soluble lytic murein transglycosylase-like protein
MSLLKTLYLAGFALTLSISESYAAGLCERQLKDASESQGVPLGLLYAVALAETGYGGKLAPYAMNIDGKPMLATSRKEALQIFAEAKASGARLIDLGCMQINAHYHSEAFASVSDMFDPARNTAYAAKFLKSLEQKHGSWTKAVAHYHAGPKNPDAQRRYVCKVVGHLVQRGFGIWTREAKASCS